MISLSVCIVICLQLLCCSQAQTLDYIGCYKDHWFERALPQGYSRVNSPKSCREICQQKSLYTYFGNQYGSQCFCGEKYSKYGKADESDCYYDCSEDADRKCGAGNRNSVYYVCPRGRFGRNCEQYCHCKYGGGFCNRNGTCEFFADCELGWKGDSCSQDVNECEEDPTYCNQNCINTPGSFYCACYNDSFRLDSSLNRTCNDIDECKEKPGICAHSCLNTKGGYDCICNQGYNSIDGGKICADIDECEINSGGCSHFCNNAIGSFSCRCPENLELSGDGKTCRVFSSPYIGFPAWATAVLIVAVVILFAFILVMYLRRRNHRTSSATALSVTRNGDLVAVISSNDVNNKNNAIGDVTDPLYENLAGSSGATRMKVSDLPKVVERIRENPQGMSKDFKSASCRGTSTFHMIAHKKSTTEHIIIKR